VLLGRALARATDGGWATYPLSDEELLGWLGFFGPPAEDELAFFDAQGDPGRLLGTEDPS
jgi:hypothetical protein